MLWLKAMHIVFVVTWFAGLFYLPRLFIYHVEASDRVSIERFERMERRLLLITHIGGVLATVFGVATLLWFWRHTQAYLGQGWLHAKLALVVLLWAYHGWCVKLAAELRAGRSRRSSRWLRVFNEVPAVLLIAIVVLVVVKPF
jgi:putative membrane protein